jgi:type II secretory ATPase GspE/PulE/Tfp pilus assembly ATPase PilB-like protein
VALEEVLSPAFLSRASRIECAPGPNGKYQIGQYVDSMRYRREPIDAPVANAVIDYLKSHAGMDVGDKRRKQVGDMAARQGLETKNLRIRSAGSSQGQSVVIDVDLRKSVNIKPNDLGVLPQQFERLDKAIEDRRGIVLVSAARGGGRTTSLYGFLRRHDAFTRNIRTLEFEHLIQIDGVGHTEFKPVEGGPDFATQLRSMLRRDPNIMMVADLHDARTAQEAAAPGVNGPLTYIGVRANSGLEALAIWCKSVGDLKKAAVPLRAVTYQVLVRRLCDACKVPYSPPAEQMKKLGLPKDQIKQLFNASGKIIERNKEETCTVCAGLGYRGLVGCFEIMTFDDEARDLITKGDLNALRANLARQKMITLQQAALRKAIEGVTSIEEVIRATRPKSPTKKAAPQNETANAE